MPYINKHERKKYDSLINTLARILNNRVDNDELSGEMNYVLFRLAKLLCDNKSGGKRSYSRMAVISSALSEAQAEFRRQIMTPYEDKKIIKNGDVEL